MEALCRTDYPDPGMSDDLARLVDVFAKGVQCARAWDGKIRFGLTRNAESKFRFGTGVYLTVMLMYRIMNMFGRFLKWNRRCMEKASEGKVVTNHE